MVVDGVGVAHDLLVEGAVVLEDDLDVDLDLLLGVGDARLLAETDGLGMDDRLVAVELHDELDDAVAVVKRLLFRLGGALVKEGDLEAGV